MDEQEGACSVNAVHAPEHDPIGSTEEQSVGIRGDQGANQKCPSGGAQQGRDQECAGRSQDP